MTTVTSNSITGITTLTATTDVASKEYVDNKPLGTLPSQTGNAGKFLLTTDGTSLSWDYVSNYQEFTTTGIQTFTVPSQSNILLIEAVGAGAGGDAGSTGWIPTSGDPLFPNLWYDASDTTSVTLSGSTVTTWANKGSLGSTYNLTQATASRQPTYAATQNGLRTMTFDGSDDQMLTTQLNNVTHIFVASAWSAAGASSTNYKGFLSSGGYDWHGEASAVLVASAYAASWVKNQPTESTSQLDGSNFVNLTNNKWTTFSIYSINLQTGYTGGFSGSGTANGDGRQFQGDYGEILVYQNTRLTTDQINFITGYLAWKWGSQSLLPISHPYKNSSPGLGDPNFPLSGKGGASGSYTSWFVPKSIVTSNITINIGIGGVGSASSTSSGSAGAGTTISWTGPGGTYTITASGSSGTAVGVAQTFTQSSFYYSTAGLTGAVSSLATPGVSTVGNTATAQTNQFQPTGGGSGAASTTTSTGGPSGSINVYGITASASGGTSSTINGSTGIAYTGLPYGTGGGGGGAGISYDLDNWILRTSGVVDNISSIAYASNSYIFGGANRILGTSTDSISWVLRTSGFNNSLTNAILYANSTYVAGDNGGGVNTSTDGINWTLRTSGFGSNAVLSATYANSTFIAAGENGVLNTSTDSVTWTLRTTSLSNIFALTFGNNTYVAAGLVGILNTSTDTIHWTSRTAGFGLNNIRALSYADNTFVAAGVNGRLNTSTDAVTWTLRTAGFVANTIFALTYVTDSYFAAGAGGTLNSSTNGIVWSLRTSNFGATQINSLTFGNNIYLGAGNSGTISVATSGPLTPGKGGKGARGGGGGGGASIGSTFGNGGDGGDGYVKITWW